MEFLTLVAQLTIERIGSARKFRKYGDNVNENEGNARGERFHNSC